MYIALLLMILVTGLIFWGSIMAGAYVLSPILALAVLLILMISIASRY